MERKAYETLSSGHAQGFKHRDAETMVGTNGLFPHLLLILPPAGSQSHMFPAHPQE